MESGKNKVTTKEQIAKLVELMEKYPETARGKPQFGSCENKIKLLWEDITVELNSLGPPSRTAHEWGRVWIHYKANLKRKLANNRKNYLATGGGPSQEMPLSPLEESVANLVQMREQVAPGGHALGLGSVSTNMDDEENEESFPNLAMAEETNNTNLEDRPTSSSSNTLNKTRDPKKNLETERLNLLKIQVENQKEVLKKLGKIGKNIYKNYELNKKILQLKEKKFEIYKRKAKEEHELHDLKVEVEK